MASDNNTKSDLGECQATHHETQGNSSGETQESYFYFGKGDHDSQDMDLRDRDSQEITPDYQCNHGPGFAIIDGDVKTREFWRNYNDTKVDVVTVTCPGADAFQPWSGSEPFETRFFSQDNDPLEPTSHPVLKNLLDQVTITSEIASSAPETASVSYPQSTSQPVLKRLLNEVILTPGLGSNALKMAWVRQGVRKANSTARVLLYQHRALTDGVTLMDLADDLMREVARVRRGERLHKSRPLFFLAHSIGGLVVKELLVKASRSPEYRDLYHNCHGVAFFGRACFQVMVFQEFTDKYSQALLTGVRVTCPCRA